MTYTALREFEENTQVAPNIQGRIEFERYAHSLRDIFHVSLSEFKIPLKRTYIFLS